MAYRSRIALPFLVLSTCSALGEAPIAGIAIAASRDSGSLFPEFPGWKRSGSIRRYDPETLYEYINGASELYLVFGFKELTVAEYAGSGKASIVAEIYRHASPLHAFGIYSQEKTSSGNYIRCGAEGYVAPPVLNFVAGDTYVKLNGSGLGSRGAEILGNLAQMIAGSLGASPSLPPQLAWFPEEKKVPHSECFHTGNVLGYEFLPSAFTADYRDGGTTYQMMLVECADADQCRGILEKYFHVMKRPIADLKEGHYDIPDPNHGDLSLSWKGRHLCMVLRLQDPGLRARILDRMEARLPSSK